jgi:elongation factor 2
MPATRRAILGGMLLANPTLLEAVLGIEVKGPVDQIRKRKGLPLEPPKASEFIDNE